MIDWQDKIERTTLTCHRSGRSIAPGESYISTLSWSDGRFLRHDYSIDAWQEDDAEGCLSWWRHRRPRPLEDTGPRMVNNQVLLQIFLDIKDTTDRHQQCFAWLLALLLMRAKKLRYLDLQRADGEAWFLLEERGSKVVHRLRDPRMNPAEEEAVQENLSEIFDMPVLPGDTDETG